LHTFRQVCAKVNVPLAPDCEKFEKAFPASTKGTVLGINFNSENLTWQLPREKFIDTVAILKKFLEADNSSLLLLQKLHGKLNDFSQLAIFLKGFKFQQNQFLQAFSQEKASTLPIPMELKQELTVWAKCLLATHDGLPIPKFVQYPPLFPVTFISDAAGAAIRRSKGYSTNISIPGDRGVASLGYNDSEYFFLSIYKWQPIFLDKFLTHSSVFEGVSLLLPFVCIPHLLKKRNRLLLVDNEPFVSSWQRRYAKKSKFTSIIVQTLHILEATLPCRIILEATLPCRIFVQHRKRCSTTPATLVDKLSRASTTDQLALQAIQHLYCHQPRGPLLKWLEDPVLDYQLPFAIADFVASLIPQ